MIRDVESDISASCAKSFASLRCRHKDEFIGQETIRDFTQSLLQQARRKFHSGHARQAMAPRAMWGSAVRSPPVAGIARVRGFPQKVQCPSTPRSIAEWRDTRILLLARCDRCVGIRNLGRRGGTVRFLLFLRHLPIRERRISIATIASLLSFRSTLPRGGRPALKPVTVSQWGFRSTPPRGGRLCRSIYLIERGKPPTFCEPAAAPVSRTCEMPETGAKPSGCTTANLPREARPLWVRGYTIRGPSMSVTGLAPTCSIRRRHSRPRV